MTTCTEHRDYWITKRGSKFGANVYVWQDGQGSDCGLNYDLGTYRSRKAAQQAIEDDRAVNQH